MDNAGVFPGSISILQGRSESHLLELKIHSIIDSRTQIDPKGKGPTRHMFEVKTDVGKIKLTNTYNKGLQNWTAELIF